MTILVSKTVHYLPGFNVSKVLLSKSGGGLGGVVVSVRTGTTETGWNAWEVLTEGVAQELASKAPRLQVKLAGTNPTVFHSKDSRGVNEGVELTIIESLPL